MIENTFDPSISIIIPVHNGGEKFKKCLDSILNTSPSNLEAIIVADGESDGSWRYAADRGMKIIKIPETGGPARARNAGASQAIGDILLFIDSDIIIPPNTVDLVRTAFANDSELTALFGSYDDEPYEKNMLSQYRNLLHHFVHQTSNRDASTFWAGCGAIRRKIFIEIGGFNEGYRFPTIEDIELGYRLKKSGYKIRLNKDIKVKHLKYWDALSILKTDFFFRALPWTQLILKQDMFVNDLNLKTSSRVSVACVLTFILTLGVALLTPWALVLTFFSAVLLCILNWELYRFLKMKRGIIFLFQSIPWHWIYFAQSGLAFSIGYTKYKLTKK